MGCRYANRRQVQETGGGAIVTDEEILRVAEDVWAVHHLEPTQALATHVITFARLIAAKQREIDAALCEKVSDNTRPSPSSHAFQKGAIMCAAAIRSQKP